jgi:hypothetical protein
MVAAFRAIDRVFLGGEALYEIVAEQRPIEV